MIKNGYVIMLFIVLFASTVNAKVDPRHIEGTAWNIVVNENGSAYVFQNNSNVQIGFATASYDEDFYILAVIKTKNIKKFGGLYYHDSNNTIRELSYSSICKRDVSKCMIEDIIAIPVPPYDIAQMKKDTVFVITAIVNSNNIVGYNGSGIVDILGMLQSIHASKSF